MIAIKLVDARRGLNIKCRELFKDEKIAESIYRYLCDGIEECDDVEPERKHGVWEYIGGYGYQYRCSECVMCAERKTNYCPYCGAKMDGGKE